MSAPLTGLYRDRPEHVANLRKALPRATIIPGDIRKQEVLDAIRKWKGKVDIMQASIACQPSSTAATVHDPKDPRLIYGTIVMLIAAMVKPRVFLVEDVPSFKK